MSIATTVKVPTDVGDASFSGVLSYNEATNTWTLALSGSSSDGTTTTFTDIVKAAGYKSSDGTAGITAGPFTTVASIAVKNGLVTTLTGTP
jgi:hypothetical protein